MPFCFFSIHFLEVEVGYFPNEWCTLSYLLTYGITADQMCARAPGKDSWCVRKHTYNNCVAFIFLSE